MKNTSVLKVIKLRGLSFIRTWGDRQNCRGYVILKKVLEGLCNSIFEVRELFKVKSTFTILIFTFLSCYNFTYFLSFLSFLMKRKVSYRSLKGFTNFEQFIS